MSSTGLQYEYASYRAYFSFRFLDFPFGFRGLKCLFSSFLNLFLHPLQTPYIGVVSATLLTYGAFVISDSKDFAYSSKCFNGFRNLALITSTMCTAWESVVSPVFVLWPFAVVVFTGFCVLATSQHSTLPIESRLYSHLCLCGVHHAISS